MAKAQLAEKGARAAPNASGPSRKRSAPDWSDRVGAERTVDLTAGNRWPRNVRQCAAASRSVLHVRQCSALSSSVVNMDARQRV